MATQTIRFSTRGRAPVASYTVNVYPVGSLTAFATGVACTLSAVAGVYTFPLTSSSGSYWFHIFDDVSYAGEGFVTTTDTAATFDEQSLASLTTGVSGLQSGVTTLLSRITSTLFGGITALKDWLGLIAGKTADAGTLAEMNATTAGAGYSNLNDSLEAIRDRGDAAWTGGGGSGLTGANIVTITVDDGTDPVPGAYVRLTAGAETEVKRTNGSGVVTFTVDDNTWTVAIDATNLTFEPETLAVTAATSATYSMDAVATSGTSWATGDDLVAYYDAKTIGQMLRDDNTPVAVGDVPDHAIVQRMLLLATGEVDAALMQSKRYSLDQLSALGAASMEHLKNITCAVAMWHLGERRLPGNPEKQDAARKIAEAHLERLRKGELVLDVDDLITAGMADSIEFRPGDTRGTQLLRDRMSGQAGAFPKRRDNTR